MTGPAAARLGDGRLHFQHGPIDLIIELAGDERALPDAEAAAWQRFGSVLDELVPQLPVLKAPADPDAAVSGTIARRMVDAATAFADRFVTPMAAVAGSVAAEVCAVIASVPGVRRAYVNNGGDIALHLVEGESMSVGLAATGADAPMPVAIVDAFSAIRGVATSGAGGRSFSFGIADAVTVFGASAPLADVAATLIANAVDLPGHPAIERLPATELDPDSDLGDRLVTVDVGDLTTAEVDEALDRGCEEADRLVAATPGLVGVSLALAGRRRGRGEPRLDIGWRELVRGDAS